MAERRTFEVVVDEYNAGKSAYVINKARKLHPEFKISKAKLVTKKLPESGVIVGSDERGIVFKHKRGVDIRPFWDDAAKIVKDMRKRGKTTYNMSWFVLR